MTYEIEKGIPVPKISGKKGPPIKYPFLDMEVGDSFFTVVETEEVLDGAMDRLNKERARLSAACSSHSRRFPQKLIVRTVNTDTEFGVRVWRVS